MPININTADPQAELVKQTQSMAKFYEPGLLKPDSHWRIVDDLVGIARTANIPPQYIYKHSMVGTCSEAEIEWVRQLKRLPDMDIAGLAIHGTQKGLLYERMLAMAGALVRNFVDARVVTLQTLLEDIKAGAQTEGTVVIVPNFHTSPEKGGGLHPRFIGQLLDWLYQRYGEQKQTVIYIESLPLLREHYGDDIAQLVTSHYMNSL